MFQPAYWPSLFRSWQFPFVIASQDFQQHQRDLLAAGFVIEKLGTFARPEFPPDIQLDGRESVGLIARKK